MDLAAKGVHGRLGDTVSIPVFSVCSEVALLSTGAAGRGRLASELAANTSLISKINPYFLNKVHFCESGVLLNSCESFMLCEETVFLLKTKPISL